MNDFNIQKLRFWCQKVLPLVYDDSLSYYELLCKVIQKLNDVINTVDGLPDYIGELITEGSLKNIIDSLLTELRHQIANADEGFSDTASADRIVGEIVWISDKTYRCIKQINAGDRYIVGSNIEKITIESIIKDLKSNIAVYFEVNQSNASKNIKEGEVIWYNNGLIECTKDIEIGNKYVENVNYEKTNVAKLIANEKTSRKNSDNALQINIDNEATARKNADADILKKILTEQSYVTPQMFGAIGDGVNDDSQFILEAFNNCKTTNKILLLDKNYKVGSDITLSGKTPTGNYGKVSILCCGTIIPFAKITIKECFYSTIEIDLEGGGNVEGALCSLVALESCNVKLRASNTKATAFQIGGGNLNNVHWSVFSIICRDCYRSFIHGDDNGNQSAFGSYEYIYDYNPSYGCIIKNSYDININHFEGLFVDRTKTKNSFEIINGGSIHFGDFAQGGFAKYLLYCENTNVNIGYAFLTGEKFDEPYSCIGICIKNNGYCAIDTMRLYYVEKGIELNGTTENSTLVTIAQEYCLPIDHVIPFDLNGNSASFYIGNLPVSIIPSKTTEANINVSDITVSVTGRIVQVCGNITPTENIDAYKPLLITNTRPKHSAPGIMCSLTGTIIPIYINTDTNYIIARTPLTANETYAINISYEMDMPLM